MTEPTSGWSSGSGTPVRRTPATGTTSATSSTTSWPTGSAASFRSHKTGRADVVEGRLGGPGGAARRAGPAALLHERDRGTGRRRWRSSTRCRPSAIVAVHDELDIAFDTLRVKLGGGDNGHNGLRSMRSLAGHRRLLPGPGRHRPAARAAGAADFVLSDYSSTERKELPFQVDRAADAVESLLTEGLERTQSLFNS